MLYKMYCSRCKTTKGRFTCIQTQILKKTGVEKHYYYCHKCNLTRLKAYRQTNVGKAAARRAVVKYEENHPERVSAWKKCAYLGTKPCEKCGAGKTDKHHPNVALPFYVQWLCRYHHKRAHDTV